MKIAIFTLPLHTNYGGLLQAYALQTVLERMGHEVVVLDKPRKPRIYIPKIVRFKRFVLKYILRKDLPETLEMADYNRRKQQNFYTWKFADTYIHRCEVADFDTFPFTSYDAIVVGSDQVLRPQYFCTNYNLSISYAYLKPVEGKCILKIMFSASFGSDKWEYTQEETEKCSKLISDFSFVSLRESDGVRLMSEKLNYHKAVVTLDPTMLLSVQDYDKLITKNREQTTQSGVMQYLIDRSYSIDSAVQEIVSMLNLPSFSVNSQVEDEKSDNRDNAVQPPLSSWLQGFQNARLVVTDSFHACVFSIIYGKPFIVFSNPKRGTSRVTSLLASLKLMHRMIINPKNYQLKELLDSWMQDEDIKNAQVFMCKEVDRTKTLLSKCFADSL